MDESEHSSIYSPLTQRMEEALMSYFYSKALLYKIFLADQLTGGGGEKFPPNKMSGGNLAETAVDVLHLMQI